MDLLEYIKEAGNSPEMKRFKMWVYFNHHLTLYQNFNEVALRLYVSYSDADEHDWIIGLNLLCWGFEFSWNGRKKKKDEHRGDLLDELFPEEKLHSN